MTKEDDEKFKEFMTMALIVDYYSENIEKKNKIVDKFLKHHDDIGVSKEAAQEVVEKFNSIF